MRVFSPVPLRVQNFAETKKMHRVPMRLRSLSLSLSPFSACSGNKRVYVKKLTGQLDQFSTNNLPVVIAMIITLVTGEHNSIVHYYLIQCIVLLS